MKKRYNNAKNLRLTFISMKNNLMHQEQFSSSFSQLYEGYKDRIRLGSLSISQANYPFSTFLIGFFIGRVNTDFEHTFQFIELIDCLEQLKIVTIDQAKRIVKLLTEFPRDIVKMLKVLDGFKGGEERDINSWIESYEVSKYLELQDDKEKYQGQMISPNLCIAKHEKMETQQIDKTIKRNMFNADEGHRTALIRMQQQIDTGKQNQAVGQVDDALCQICCLGLYEDEFFAFDKCEHIFHNNCLVELIKTNILHNDFPIRCPKDGCDMNITEFDIRGLLSYQLFQKYQDHTLKAYAGVHGDSISWCPTPSCGYMFFFQKGDGSFFQCPECKKAYCLNCRVDWHELQTCKEYSINSTTSEEDNKFMSYVQGEKYKQCPQCKFWVSKNSGCDHMTCKCTFQFCYKCGGVFQKCECVAKRRKRQQYLLQRAEEKRRRKLELQERTIAKLSHPKLLNQQQRSRKE